MSVLDEVCLRTLAKYVNGNRSIIVVTKYMYIFEADWLWNNPPLAWSIDKLVRAGDTPGWVCPRMLVNTLRPRQDGRHFPDDTFKHIFLRVSIKISLKFVPKGPINNIPALVKIMAWRRPGDNHYLNQWWLDYRRIYVSLSLNELTLCIFKLMMYNSINIVTISSPHDILSWKIQWW